MESTSISKIIVYQLYYFVSSLGWWGVYYAALILVVFVVFFISEMISASKWLHLALSNQNKFSFPRWLSFFIPEDKENTNKGFVPANVFLRPMLFTWFAILVAINIIGALIVGFFWPISLPVAVFPLVNDFYIMMKNMMTAFLKRKIKEKKN